MYTSQSMLILALLLLLTAALFYNTIDFQRRQIIEEMRATSVDLKSSSIEHVVSSSISPVFNKVLNNASLKVANEGFFDSPEEVIEYLENNTENCINDYLDNISRYYSDQGYNFTYFFNITNITMVDGFTFKISYIFNYTLSYNGTINKTKNINSSQYVTVKTILDAYHYRKPTYIMPIYIYNPNNYDLIDFQVNITLNNSNFNFSIDQNGTGLRFVYNNTYIPYWIEYWNYTNDRAIIWIKVPELEAHENTTIYLVSTYPKISESNRNSVIGTTYAPIEPKVYVSGKIKRIYPLIYISPDRAYGTHYGEGVSYNPYFVEDPSGQYPSIVDMLAGRNTTKEWKYGYSIKLTGLPISED